MGGKIIFFKIFMAGIYIHIPFCMSKCPYCDFYSVPGAKTGKIEAFAAALENEIDFYGERYAEKPIELL